MKHIKWDISLKAWVRSPGWTWGLGGGQKSTFSEYCHVAYQIKEIEMYNNIHVKTGPHSAVGSESDQIQGLRVLSRPGPILLWRLVIKEFLRFR